MGKCLTCNGVGILEGYGVYPAVACSSCKGSGKEEIVKEYWKGIGKVSEECGELLQVVGKAIAFPVGNHPDGKGNVRKRFIEEIADVYAALDYFCEANNIEFRLTKGRRKHKLDKFKKWGLDGIVHKE